MENYEPIPVDFTTPVAQIRAHEVAVAAFLADFFDMEDEARTAFGPLPDIPEPGRREIVELSRINGLMLIARADFRAGAGKWEAKRLVEKEMQVSQIAKRKCQVDEIFYGIDLGEETDVKKRHYGRSLLPLRVLLQGVVVDDEEKKPMKSVMR